MDELTTTGGAAVPVPTFNLGALIGRGQAFGLVTSHCSAAQAECLAQIRDAGLYKVLNLTWEQFCEQHVGASRAHADEIIRQLKEFGAAYFRLSEIIRISPQSYRMIEGAVKDEAIEVDGQSIPIVPENAPRIRQAIATLRAELRMADAARARSSLGITALQARLADSFEEMSSMSRRPLDAGERTAFLGLVHYSLNKLRCVARQLRNNPRA